MRPLNLCLTPHLYREAKICDKDNRTILEPYEDAFIETPPDYEQKVMSLMVSRKGVMLGMEAGNPGTGGSSYSRLHFEVSSRGLLEELRTPCPKTHRRFQGLIRTLTPET